MKAARPVMTPVTVHPVRSRRERRAFIAFPYVLYHGCSHWTAPLRRDMAHTLNHGNPFLAHGAIAPFIAVDAAGSVVGRIAAIVNGRHLEKHQDGAGFFGFFECVEDYEAAGALDRKSVV